MIPTPPPRHQAPAYLGDAIMEGNTAIPEQLHGEAVCAEGLAIDVFDGLASLLDKSLVQQQEGVGGELRFTLLELSHAYALSAWRRPARRRRCADATPNTSSPWPSARSQSSGSRGTITGARSLSSSGATSARPWPGA
jgi:hypothetical protein